MLLHLTRKIGTSGLPHAWRTGAYCLPTFKSFIRTMATTFFSLRRPYIQTNLPQELIEEVLRRLSISSLKTARQVCRSFASIVNDDLFASKKAIDMYGREFWVRGSARPVHSSQPMHRVIDELLRIEKFQTGVQKLHDRRFQAADFYKMWRHLDKRRI